MKKLFSITKTAEFFEDKQEAKARRDELNGGPLVVRDKDGKTIAVNDNGFRITRGPDHWKAF